MFKRLLVAKDVVEAERKIIDPAVAEGLKLLPRQTDRRNQAKLIVTLYAWAVHLAFNAKLRTVSEQDRQNIIIQIGMAAINKHTREQHNGYVHWLSHNAPPGMDGGKTHELLREAFPFFFYMIVNHLWLMPSLEENIHPNTIRHVLMRWQRAPEFCNATVDFVGLLVQIDDLCVAGSIAAAHTYGLTTGRLIHRSVVPHSKAELPEPVEVFLSYAAEDRAAVAQLEKALRDIGRLPWFDKQITPQGRFDRQINTQLDDSFFVVVLWSRWSVNSHWVRGEALRALDHNKLLCVVLDDVTPPVPFNTVQALNCERSGDHISEDGLRQITSMVDASFKSLGA